MFLYYVLYRLAHLQSLYKRFQIDLRAQPALRHHPESRQALWPTWQTAAYNFASGLNINACARPWPTLRQPGKVVRRRAFPRITLATRRQPPLLLSCLQKYAGDPAESGANRIRPHCTPIELKSPHFSITNDITAYILCITTPSFADAGTGATQLKMSYAVKLAEETLKR